MLCEDFVADDADFQFITNDGPGSRNGSGWQIMLNLKYQDGTICPVANSILKKEIQEMTKAERNLQ